MKNSGEKLTKELVVAYINSGWTRSKVEDLLVDEIASGNWLDEDWEDEYDSEEDWYRDYGRGEAEDAIRIQIDEDVKKHFEVTYEEYEEIIGECLWDTVVEIFDNLQTI